MEPLKIPVFKNQLPREASIKTCPVCYIVHYNGKRVCTGCGHVFYIHKEEK